MRIKMNNDMELVLDNNNGKGPCIMSLVDSDGEILSASKVDEEVLFDFLTSEFVLGNDKSLMKEAAIRNRKATDPSKIYGISIVNSDGYDSGKESYVSISPVFEECISNAYQEYIKTWETLKENGDIDEENLDENGDGFLSEEEFKEDLLKSGYVLIQLCSSHIQFEYFEREIEANKDYSLEQENEKNTAEEIEDEYSVSKTLNERFVEKVKRTLKYSEEDCDMLLHDLNNLRGQEWIEILEEENVKLAEELALLIDYEKEEDISKMDKENLYFHRLLHSSCADDRIKAAKADYRLDILVNDDVAEVREAVAYRGYGLDKLISDSDIDVEAAVLLYLEHIGMATDIDGWISANPDKCVLSENKHNVNQSNKKKTLSDQILSAFTCDVKSISTDESPVKEHSNESKKRDLEQSL